MVFEDDLGLMTNDEIETLSKVEIKQEEVLDATSGASEGAEAGAGAVAGAAAAA